MNPTVTVDNMNFIQRAFAEGGFVMYVIAVIAILALFVIIERMMKLKNLAVDKKEFTDQIFRMVVAGDLRQAISYCDARPAPLTNTVKAGLVQAMNKRPDEEVQVAMDAAVMREMPKVEGWTSFLAVFGNVAVLAGLLGTIIGMIGSFRAVAAADPATKALELSKGISHALNCTAFGLLVAIISIVAYGLFQHRIQKTENEVVETSMSLLNLVVANREKIKD
ncbi:MotA/TolQ/ExbB proton channel family protein [Bdellovibrio bacteriovorus]|uniref:Adventurous gliding motility protein R n=4 Tax=Bdellovibrio bacteriovorus TaxID=959 RepID=Q6MPL4_BDEBA|nr:MotA/TolQ/ExbB proton channel family protein [Bdellovibrio bacteriovorus]BEV67333.1 Tol-Pal system protein TolQ [Bdellovibrio bacteriovorus]CAE78783.1 Adventurous gliding motility protein R [Bdellovibrio bacteriovorus HD100]